MIGKPQYTHQFSLRHATVKIRQPPDQLVPLPHLDFRGGEAVSGEQ